MRYNKLKEYFEKYIEQYEPYKDNESFIAIAKYLKTYYFKDSYCEIPQIFKEMFESNIISANVYDLILTSDGFPHETINELTISEKEILIKSFIDFHKYSGTLYFLQKLAAEFNNRLNIYELYLDCEVDEGNIGTWCFVPHIVYKSQSLSEQIGIIDYKLNYDFIYPKAEKFYIEESQLEDLRLNNSIVTPFKTNLLLLDFYIVYDKLGAFQQLQHMTTLSHYYDREIRLEVRYLDLDAIPNQCENKEEYNYSIPKKIFHLNLISWYQLYYYVYLTYYNDTYGVLPLLQTPMPIFPIITPSMHFEYQINELEELIEEYNKINSLNQSSDFFQKYIREPFISISQQNREISCVDLESFLLSSSSTIDKELIYYIKRRINISNNKITETMSILDDLIYGFQTFKFTESNEVYKTYLNNLLRSLPYLIIKPQNTPTYTLLHEFKPFHTQLIGDQHTKLVTDYNNKFHIVNMDDQHEKNIIEHTTSVLPATTGMSLKYNIFKKLPQINIPVISTAKLLINRFHTDDIMIKDYYNITKT